ECRTRDTTDSWTCWFLRVRDRLLQPLMRSACPLYFIRPPYSPDEPSFPLMCLPARLDQRSEVRYHMRTTVTRLSRTARYSTAWTGVLAACVLMKTTQLASEEIPSLLLQSNVMAETSQPRKNWDAAAVLDSQRAHLMLIGVASANRLRELKTHS